MPKRFEDMKTLDPEVLKKAMSGLLMTAGTRVIDGVVNGILEKTQPDGSSQKSNMASTIKRKKHDHPLIGGAAESPLLAKQSTYKKAHVDGGRAVQIAIKGKRADVGVWVQRKGYLFFDFTAYSDREIKKLLDKFAKYWSRKIFIEKNEVVSDKTGVA